MKLIRNAAALFAIPFILAWDVWDSARRLRRLRRQWKMKGGDRGGG